MGQCELREEKQKRSFAKRVRMANLVLNIAALSFLLTGCLSNPGGATRNKCPAKPPTIQEFNATEYLGIWYEQRRFPAFFHLNTRCVRATYGPCPDPDQPGACDDKPDRVSVSTWQRKQTATWTQSLGRLMCLTQNILESSLSSSLETPRVLTGSWKLTTSTTLLSTLARISCLERSSLSLLGSWQESNTLILKCLSMRPMCLWRMGSTSHPWRTLSRMRTACMRETFDCLESLFIRSVLLWSSYLLLIKSSVNKYNSL